MKHKKLCIIGAPGSGKTYLANLLRKKYDIPIHDLDDIFWDRKCNSYGTKATDTDRNNDLLTILQNDQWITEGVYFKWLTPAFKQADKIIIWHTPLWLRQLRIIKRFVKRRLRMIESKKETLIEFQKLLAYNHRFYKREMKSIMETLKEFESKTIECSSVKQLISILEN